MGTLRNIRYIVMTCALLTAAAQVVAQKLVVGGDISLLPKYEERGVAFKRSNGLAIPNVLQFLKSDAVGWNAIRVRLFVDPANDSDPAVCQDLDYVTLFAKRIKDEGFDLMLDIHYSDTWADPSHQTVPKAWEGLNATQLATKVYDYTKAVLEHLVTAGATPDYVQVGNEVTCGMLWDYGRINSGGKNNLSNFSNFLKQGIKACREVCPDAKVIVHLEHIQNASYTVSNYNNLKVRGVDFDIMGLSYYPFWHGDIATLRTALNALTEKFPDKEIQIVETAYYYQYQPAVGEGSTYDFSETWPISKDGQVSFLQDLIAELKLHANVTGLYWWCPEENGTGPNEDKSVMSGWLNRGLWNNSTHRAHPALLELKSFLDREDAVVAPRAAVGQSDWHSLQGFRTKERPTTPGVYVHQGHKVAVSPR